MRIHGRALSKVVAAAAVVLSLAGGASAATTIKLATLVPEGSVWDRELRGMGEAWREATDGRVSLRLYPGGVAGDEKDVIRKIRIGQLHAATITVTGLAEIDAAFNVFTVPRFFTSYEELFHVVDELTPMLERRLDEEGYVLLNWGHAGWVHLFSKEAVHTPEDVKGLKLFTSAGDNEMVQWWKSNGYRPVPLSQTDIMTGLQTGLIEALPTTPLAALTLQWFRTTPYMLDLGLAPLVGATIVSKRTWNGLSEGDRTAILESAVAVGERLEEAIPDQDRRAIEEMKSRGLEVTAPRGPEEREAWESEARRFAATMQEQMVPDEVFRAAVAARDAFRADSPD